MDRFQIIYCRLFLMKQGSLDGIDSTRIGREVVTKFNRQYKFSNLEDYIFSNLGYKDDSYYSSSERYAKRKELVKNSGDLDYLRSLEVANGFNRTSELVEYLANLDLLGLGKENISLKPQKYSFTGFESFLSKYRDVVEIFCAGADFMKIPNTELEFNQLKYELGNQGFKEFKETLKSLNLTSVEVVRPHVGKTIKMVPRGLQVVKSIIDEVSIDFLSDCVLYAYIIGADKINLRFKKSTEIYLAKAYNLFSCGEEDFKNCIDLSFIYNTTVYDMFSFIGLSLPDPDEMIKLSNGLFFVAQREDGRDVLYMPKVKLTKNALPICIREEEFPKFISLGVSSDIEYDKGIPYLNGDCLVDLGGDY